MTTRLQDPNGLLPADKLQRYDKRMSNVMTRLLANHRDGGNPFVFAIAASKPHIIADRLPDRPYDVPSGEKCDKCKGGLGFHTAATDGRTYYWHPCFLARLNEGETRVVMEHEVYHYAFFHCEASRSAGKDPHIWPLAIDYTVNGTIYHDMASRKRDRGSYPGFSGNREVFDRGLGKPMHIDELVAILQGRIKINPEDPREPRCFMDPSDDYKDFGADDFYELIMKSVIRCKACGRVAPNGIHSLDANGECKQKITIHVKGQGSDQDGQGGGEGGGEDGNQEGDGDGESQSPGQSPGSGKSGGKTHKICPGQLEDLLNSLDAHMVPKVSKDEALWDITKALETSKQMRGTAPAGMQEMLGELLEPELSMQDLMRIALQNKKLNQGQRNDPHRYRRRYLAMEPEMFLHRKFTYNPTWIVAYDCSGSMDKSDIEYGLKEMKPLAAEGEGLAVPFDATIYWDQMKPIGSVDDLRALKAVGRGGTTVQEFFRDLRVKTGGKPFDLVAVVTDGYIDAVPAHYNPGCDVLWILTSGYDDFSPPFGRKVVLRKRHR